MICSSLNSPPIEQKWSQLPVLKAHSKLFAFYDMQVIYLSKYLSFMSWNLKSLQIRLEQNNIEQRFLRIVMIYPKRDRRGWWLRSQRCRIEEVSVRYLSTWTSSQKAPPGINVAPAQQPASYQGLGKKKTMFPLSMNRLILKWSTIWLAFILSDTSGEIYS